MATKFDGVVIGIHEGGKFTQQGELLNEKSNGALKKQWELTSKKGKSGESTLVLGALPEYPRISIVGLGKEEKDREDGEDNIHAQRLAAGLGVKSLKANGAKMVGVDSSFGNLQATSEGTHMSLYKYYLKKAKEEDTPIEVAPFSVESAETPAEWQNGKIIAQAQNFARDLAETPANLMTPNIFCNTILEKFTALENKDKVEVVIRDEKWIQEKGMGMFWGVAKGSTEPPRLLEVHYKGASDATSPPLVFVGKGVTFDSGGISIKPSANMSLMKGDMQGAASVVSAAYAIALLKLPINVTVITPLAENMPSGGATKPGDVLTAINKKTVEIDNTDAEGRLLLGDALYYAHSFNPHTLVDVATLTGAIEVALGTLAAGAFTPSDALWNELSEASKKTNERFWRMPLYKEYKKQLESRVADLMNSSPKRSGGACTAAIFLKEFTEIERWAHLDIAGIMQNSDDSAIASKGLSGKPVRTLVELAKTYINSIPSTPVKKDKQ